MFGWGKRSQDGEDVHQWDSELSQRYGNQDGYTRSNAVDNEDMKYEPTYRAKPIPRTLVLRWEDRLAPSSAAQQKTTFSFNLPREINGYNTMTLVHASYNPNWFVTMGALLCIGMDPIKTSAAITSFDNKGVRGFIPVFCTGNLGPQFGQPNFARTSNWINLMHTDAVVNIRDMDLTSMTIYLGDESLETYQVNPVPPIDPFYCTLTFRLE